MRMQTRKISRMEKLDITFLVLPSCYHGMKHMTYNHGINCVWYNMKRLSDF